MKTTILKSVMMVLLALFSLNANAYDDIRIDGIYYILDPEAKTAQVSNGVGGNRSMQSYSDEAIKSNRARRINAIIKIKVTVKNILIATTFSFICLILEFLGTFAASITEISGVEELI